jgi:anhydro-N-acetylmuramic acid kinase
MLLPPVDWSAQPRRLVGLMSGTSLDGVDAALIEVTGSIPPAAWRLLAFITRPYTPDERARIGQLLTPTVALADLTYGHAWLGELFADATLQLLKKAGMEATAVDAVASHGQTVWHIPPEAGHPGATLQLGAPAIIAERTGILTVADFRPRDMAAGGHGAPLVPFADFLLFRDPALSRAVLNIGGIANLTYLPAGGGPEAILAFDTGPGNMIIDALVTQATNGMATFDADGVRAARGRVDHALLACLLGHPYFAAPPPKSTGREAFGRLFAETLWTDYGATMPADDLIATVTAVTAASIAAAVHDFLLPRGPVDELILGGGGAFNPTLRQMLAERLPGIRLCTHEAYGIPSDAKEAIAFALLGHATLCGIPNNVPAATGARHPVVLGTIVPGHPSPSPSP